MVSFGSGRGDWDWGDHEIIKWRLGRVEMVEALDIGMLSEALGRNLSESRAAT